MIIERAARDALAARLRHAALDADRRAAGDASRRRRKDGAVDQVVRAVPIVGLGLPPFWLGIMLMLVFAACSSGRCSPSAATASGFGGHLVSMFLPALTVALGIAPILIRSLRASLLEVLESDYITTARVEGDSPSAASSSATRCATRSCSMVTVLGINLGFLVGSTVVVEKVFALPGVGQLMIIDGILQRDFPVVQAVTLVLAPSSCSSTSRSTSRTRCSTRA